MIISELLSKEFIHFLHKSNKRVFLCKNYEVQIFVCKCTSKGEVDTYKIYLSICTLIPSTFVL